MPLWYTKLQEFTPLSIDGLIGWYDSNSAIFDANTNLIKWTDKGYFKNDLIPSVNTITNSFIFNNAVLTNSNKLDLQFIASGATLFIVADLSDNEFDTSNYVSFFTDNIQEPSRLNNLTVGIEHNNSKKYLSISDLSHTEYQFINPNLPKCNKNIINAICFNTLIQHPQALDQIAFYSAGYINNTLYTESCNPKTISTNPLDFNIFIGDRLTNIGPNVKYHGISNHIYEVILYNSVLSELSINNVNTYLANKHNVSLTGGNFNYINY